MIVTMRKEIKSDPNLPKRFLAGYNKLCNKSNNKFQSQFF